MGWFSSEAPQSSSKDFTSSDESSFSSNVNDSPDGFSDTGPSTNYSNSGGGGAAMMQQAVQQAQQQALIQQVISKLTVLSFDVCVGKPDSQLSSREISCIHASVGKYLDGSDFVLGRLQRKQGGN